MHVLVHYSVSPVTSEGAQQRILFTAPKLQRHQSATRSDTLARDHVVV